MNNAIRYRPDDSLTRAEFLKIVINTAGWEREDNDSFNIPFRDVTRDWWYASYVSLALSKGMIT